MRHIPVVLVISMPLLCFDQAITRTAQSIVWQQTKNPTCLKCDMLCTEMREDLCCFGYKYACCSQPLEQSVEEKAKRYLKREVLQLNGRSLDKSLFHEQLFTASGVSIKSSMHPVEGAGFLLSATCLGSRFLEYVFGLHGLTEASILCALCMCIPAGRACSYCCLQIDGIPERSE